MACGETRRPPEHLGELDNDQLNTIGYVLSRYGTNTGHDLETITHNEGPWREAYTRESGGRDRHYIHLADMREFFLTVVAADDAEDEIHIGPAALATFLEGPLGRENRPSRPDTRESLLARLRG